jgi:hypothetical protein
MDCHLNNSTTWKLMGVFKEASYFGNDAFFEQLFKHEGVCVWNDDDLYDFMSESRESAWPQGCVSTGIRISSTYYYEYSDYIYIDLKPTWNGNMTYGLYTDSMCKNEYELPDKDVETIAKSMNLLYGSSLDKWNDALEIFKVCQPCKAYNLQKTYSSTSYNDNGNYNKYYDPNKGYFRCNDDAGYTNVNQCMKFRTHAELEVATWEDLVTATNQGGILEVNISGTIFGSDRMSAEQYQYMLKVRRSEVASEAKAILDRKTEIARVAALEPVADKWMNYGGTFLTVGMVSMLLVVGLVVKAFYDRAYPKKMSEPLLPSIKFNWHWGRPDFKGGPNFLRYQPKTEDIDVEAYRGSYVHEMNTTNYELDSNLVEDDTQYEHVEEYSDVGETYSYSSMEPETGNAAPRMVHIPGNLAGSHLTRKKSTTGYENTKILFKRAPRFLSSEKHKAPRTTQDPEALYAPSSFSMIDEKKGTKEDHVQVGDVNPSSNLASEITEATEVNEVASVTRSMTDNNQSLDDLPLDNIHGRENARAEENDNSDGAASETVDILSADCYDQEVDTVADENEKDAEASNEKNSAAKNKNDADSSNDRDADVPNENDADALSNEKDTDASDVPTSTEICPPDERVESTELNYNDTKPSMSVEIYGVSTKHDTNEMTEEHNDVLVDQGKEINDSSAAVENDLSQKPSDDSIYIEDNVEKGEDIATEDQGMSADQVDEDDVELARKVSNEVSDEENRSEEEPKDEIATIPISSWAMARASLTSTETNFRTEQEDEKKEE